MCNLIFRERIGQDLATKSGYCWQNGYLFLPRHCPRLWNCFWFPFWKHENELKFWVTLKRKIWM